MFHGIVYCEYDIDVGIASKRLRTLRIKIMIRIMIKKAGVLGLVASCLLTAPLCLSASKKPNVLFIAIDDLRLMKNLQNCN